MFFWWKLTHLVARESPLGSQTWRTVRIKKKCNTSIRIFTILQSTDTTHFFPCLHPYFMGVWISVQDHRYEFRMFYLWCWTRADPSGLTLWAGCQIVVDPSLKPRNCVRVRIYDYLPACVCVWCYMDASNKPIHTCICVRVQLLYCLREWAIWSILGAGRETQRSMSCDHEVWAAYYH